mgnify:CR=1 FL=1
METKAVNTTAELEKELGMSEQELFSFVEYHAEDAERIGYSEYSGAFPAPSSRIRPPWS